MVIWNLIIVNNNHLVFKKEKPVGPTNFIIEITLSITCEVFLFYAAIDVQVNVMNDAQPVADGETALRARRGLSGRADRAVPLISRNPQQVSRPTRR